jgi:CheY-like chemotaxis protein
MGYKLLLADDSITIQKVVGIIFSGEEYDLTVVDNGISALERVREVVPDVMLVDALMPGKNGYEVCREVRKDPLLSAVPILLLTGVFEPFDETKARESGADDFIAKPFESQALIDKVRELISLGARRVAARPPEPVATPVTPAQEPFRMLAHEAGADTLTDAMAAAAAAVNLQVAIPSTPPPLADAEISPEEEELLEIEEVTSLDDLWGMDLVEEEHQDLIPFGVVIDQKEGESLEGIEELEPFVFEEEQPVQPVAYDFAALPERSGESFSFDLERGTGEFAGTGVSASETSDVLPVLPASAEEEFSFEVEPVAGVLPTAVQTGGLTFAGEPEPSQHVTVLESRDTAAEAFPLEVVPDKVLPLVEKVPEEFGFAVPAGAGEPGVAPASTPAAGEPLPVIVPDVTEVAEPCAAALPEPAEVAQELPQEALSVAAPVTEGNVSITEEQLAAALSKFSREVIERIVWEVVPDLAESLIREEIRKIKEGA